MGEPDLADLESIGWHPRDPSEADVLEDLEDHSQPHTVQHLSGIAPAPDSSLLNAFAKRKTFGVAFLSGALFSSLVRQVPLPLPSRTAEPARVTSEREDTNTWVAMDRVEPIILVFSRRDAGFVLDYANYAAEATLQRGLRSSYGKTYTEIWPTGLVSLSESSVALQPAMDQVLVEDTQLGLGRGQLASGMKRDFRVTLSPRDDQVMVSLSPTMPTLREGPVSMEHQLRQRVSSLDWMVRSAKEDLVFIEALASEGADGF